LASWPTYVELDAQGIGDGLEWQDPAARESDDLKLGG